jgi:hypothetical protein
MYPNVRLGRDISIKAPEIPTPCRSPLSSSARPSLLSPHPTSLSMPGTDILTEGGGEVQIETRWSRVYVCAPSGARLETLPVLSRWGG